MAFLTSQVEKRVESREMMKCEKIPHKTSIISLFSLHKEKNFLASGLPRDDLDYKKHGLKNPEQSGSNPEAEK